MVERKGLLALLGEACQSSVLDQCGLLGLATWRILRESGQCLMTDLRGGVVLVGLGMYWALSMHRPCNNVFFLPFSRMAVGGKVCLQESDELFSPCCSNTRCPASTPGQRRHICSASRADVQPQGVLAMYVRLWISISRGL